MPYAGADPQLATSRRDLLLRGGGALAAAIGVAACGTEEDEAPAERRARAADLQIVNYVLTIELLEEALYDRAIETGFFIGGELDIIRRFREQEREHVDTLTAAIGKLGGRAAEPPRPAFPARDRVAMLRAAQRLENLGAAAYLGQAARIQDREILAAALSIHSVEARHAATLNSILDKDITPTGAFAKPASMEEVLPVIQLFVAA
jgi:ferritin-like protein